MLRARNKDLMDEFDMRQSWHSDLVHGICMPRSKKAYILIVTNPNIILVS